MRFEAQRASLHPCGAALTVPPSRGRRFLDTIVTPNLVANTSWGNMVASDPSKAGLFGALANFSLALQQAKNAVDATVSLDDFTGEEEGGWRIGSIVGSDAEACRNIAQNDAIRDRLERLVSRWCEKISRVSVWCLLFGVWCARVLGLLQACLPAGVSSHVHGAAQRIRGGGLEYVAGCRVCFHGKQLTGGSAA